MGGVAKRAKVRVVRRSDHDLAPRLQQPVELLQHLDHIGDMLDDVDGPNLSEGAIAEGVREVVEVTDHVRLRPRIHIDPDRARVFVDAATDIESPRHVAFSLAGSALGHSLRGCSGG